MRVIFEDAVYLRIYGYKPGGGHGGLWRAGGGELTERVQSRDHACRFATLAVLDNRIGMKLHQPIEHNAHPIYTNFEVLWNIRNNYLQVFCIRTFRDLRASRSGRAVATAAPGTLPDVYQPVSDFQKHSFKNDGEDHRWWLVSLMNTVTHFLRRVLVSARTFLLNIIVKMLCVTCEWNLLFWFNYYLFIVSVYYLFLFIYWFVVHLFIYLRIYYLMSIMVN